MAKSSKDYFGLPWIVSVILAIIPVTNIIFGIVIRATRGKVLGAVLNFFLCPLFWLVDLITIIASKKVTFLA
ncbi:MAG: hypothetical protein RR348_02860 [Clostridia bacterium]